MSEFNVVVTQLGKIGKHPNADNLEITQVHGGYPCIIKAGSFKQGDLAAYIPIDAMVSIEDERFSFLGNSQSPKSIDGKQYYRIKAIRLRGIFSMGLLIKPEDEWVENQNVQNELKIVKYEPPINIRNTLGCDSPASSQHWMPKYTDIEGLRKFKDLFQIGEQVVLTEKLHGANSRFTFCDDELRVGSHHMFKQYHKDNIWWRVAALYELEKKLKDFQSFGIYGEVFGQVQDLRYGATQTNPLMLRIFDVIDTTTNRYFHYDEFKALCEQLELLPVPEIYAGPWLGYEEMAKFADGQSSLADHIREGFVVRPVIERWDNRVGRVVLKMIGSEYLLRKNR